MVKYSKEEAQELMRTARADLAEMDRMLANRRAADPLVNIVPFPKREEPEPERRRYSDSLVDRLLNEHAEMVRTMFTEHREYVHGLLTTMLADLNLCYIEGDVSKLREDFEVHRSEITGRLDRIESDLAVLRAENDAHAAEIARLDADITNLQDEQRGTDTFVRTQFDKVFATIEVARVARLRRLSSA